MPKFKVESHPIQVKYDENTIGDIEFTCMYKCFICKHWDKSDTCKAFPEGIPDDILSGENDHSEKHPEQNNNIVFEAKE